MKTEVTMDSLPGALRELQPGLSLLHVPISKTGARERAMRWAGARGAVWFDTDFRGFDTDEIGDTVVFTAHKASDILYYTQEAVRLGCTTVVIWPLNGVVTSTPDPSEQPIAEIPVMAMKLDRGLRGAGAVGLAAVYTRTEINHAGVVMKDPHWHRGFNILKLVGI